MFKVKCLILSLLVLTIAGCSTTKPSIDVEPIQATKTDYNHQTINEIGTLLSIDLLSDPYLIELITGNSCRNPYTSDEFFEMFYDPEPIDTIDRLPDPVRKMCEVHNIRLQKSKVPIIYGGFLYVATLNEEEMNLHIKEQARIKSLYPYARTSTTAGCTILPESPIHEMVYLCDKCVKVKKKDDARKLAQEKKEFLLKMQKEPEVIDENTKQVTYLHKATEAGFSNIVKKLIKRNYPVDQQDRNGFTALHIAASRGDSKIIKILLKAGANTNAKNVQGNTPLHFSTMSAPIEIIKILIDNGAEVSESDYNAVLWNRLHPEVGPYLLLILSQQAISKK